MPIYKGSTEVASGNLYKGSTEIQDGYKATDSFYVNEISISFLNFPGQADYIITGAPGTTISATRSVSWTETAPSGSAYNGTQTASGVPTGFSFTGGQEGNISYTTTTPNVNFVSSVFPNTNTSVDYNSLTISLPTTTIATYSYTFTGALGRSTSCSTFTGTACSVSSDTKASSYYGAFSYFYQNANGTGGYGANSCTQGCSVSISSSGGSSACTDNSAVSQASISGQIIGCGELNTFQIATQASKSGPSCATGDNIAFYAWSGTGPVNQFLANINPNNSGSYNQTVTSNSNAQNYLGQYVVGYAKSVLVTAAFFGGGNYQIPNPCPSS